MIITQQLINTKSKYGNKNGKKYITIHESDNRDKGANAQAHADLQKSGYKASWHYQVDDKQAIQSFTHDFQLYHAGDGRGDGNLNSIAIEMCVNDDSNYINTVKNTIAVVKKIMREEKIPVSRVKPHTFFSKKNCPKILLSGKMGINWNDFIKELGQEKWEILKIDGYMGKKTIRRLQDALGTPQDGIISKPSAMVKELQRRLNEGSI